jgi:predicted AAA+ superfamily ATPase
VQAPLFEHSYGTVLDELVCRLEEPAPGRVQLLAGPRQVGKTTLLGEIEARWKTRAIYLAADAPDASLPGWWERQWQRAREKAVAAGRAVLLLDEIQYLPGWSRLLKHEADRLRRERQPLHVVVSGSSALQLGHGARETMAGRFERLRLLHWPAAELVARLKVPRGIAADSIVARGGYPGAQVFHSDDRRCRRYLLDSIVEPAVGRDLLQTEAVRKPALLRQVFAIAVGHPAEILSLQKLQAGLPEAGSLATVAHYLNLLEEACLVAPLPKFSRRVVRQRAAPPKLVILNNALLWAGGDRPPTPATECARWGRWVENACIALAWNAGQRVWYWREEPQEVDFVTDGSWGPLAVEVKTGPYCSRDLAGLLEFHRRYPDVRPLVLCDPGQEESARRLGLPVRTWREYLLEGP